MWTANKLPATVEHTLITQTVVYIEDNSSITLIYKIEAVDYSPPWPDDLVNRQLAILNATGTVDVKSIPTGAPQPKPVIVPLPPDPAVVAQFELDAANAKLVSLKTVADAQAWAADQTDPTVVDILKQVNTAQTTLSVLTPIQVSGVVTNTKAAIT